MMTKTPSTLSKKRIVLAALEDIKARDIQAIKVDKITSICDWVVIASAESARQTKALARHVQDKLREAGSTIIGTEGEDGAEWILVDAGDVIAHIMQPTARAYYDLEELWGEGKFDSPLNPSAIIQGLRTSTGEEVKIKVRARKPKAVIPAKAGTRLPKALIPAKAGTRLPKPARRKTS